MTADAAGLRVFIVVPLSTSPWDDLTHISETLFGSIWPQLASFIEDRAWEETIDLTRPFASFGAT